MVNPTFVETDTIILEPGEVTSCPECNCGRYECWAEIENPATDADGEVIGVSVEAGLTCLECGHVWIEVQV